jgi:acetyltransferase-like isoleucine patch superfamily enzyme
MAGSGDRTWKALLDAGVASGLATLVRRSQGDSRSADVLQELVGDLALDRIEDPKLVDYLLNTLVSKIPFPELRMALYRRAGMKVDPTTNIMMHCFVLSARNITIGPHCIIGPCTTLDGRGGEILNDPEDSLKIGRNVNIAGHVLTIEGTHKVDSPTAEGVGGKIVIEDNACVAMRATILPGVTVGEGAYVAAAALVNRDVEPYTLVGGIPARKIRDRNRDIEYTLSHFPRWI